MNARKKRIEFKHKFFLKIAALGQFPELEITEAEYNSLIAARKTLSAALSVEEKYDVVIGNFLDLEKELLMITASRVLDSRFDYDRAYELTSTLNRRVVNFVVTGKNYTKLINTKAAKCLPSNSGVDHAIAGFKSSIYDMSFNYRFMEALRDHVTHSGLAVHTVSTSDEWERDDNNKATDLVFNTSMFSLKKNISENTGFKRPVLSEMPEKVDLKRAARSYFASISMIHEEVRRLTKASIIEARNLIELYLDKYSTFNNGEKYPLGAYSADRHLAGEQPTLLILNWDDVRVKLEQKNDPATNMVRRKISNAIHQR